MKNHVSKEVALTILGAIFSNQDLKRLAKLRGIVLCGFPGCGKTTIANLLADAFGFERVSTDQIRTKELFKWQHHRMASQHEKVMVTRYMVYEELARQLNQKLNNRHKLVVDGTNLEPKRWGVLGAMLGRVSQDKVGVVVIRTPEWIIKKRFINLSKEKYEEWWSVYRYWKKYFQEGKAKFPTKKELPKVTIIKPRRYAIRTFDWIPEIKVIVWDLDGTFYQDSKELRQAFDRPCVEEFCRVKGLNLEKGTKLFQQTYERLGSKTKTLNWAGIDGQRFVEDLFTRINFSKYLKKDKKMVKVIKSLGHLEHYVLSNANRQATLRKLKALGLSQTLFKEIMVTFEMPYIKPDPRVFRLAARKVGWKPAQILTIGDREKTDMIPASEAGLHTAMVWGRSEYADVSLKTVYEVAGLFGKEV